MVKIEKKVPDLRFPEFDKDWKEKKLSEVSTLISGQHLSPEEYINKEIGFPYFTGPSDFTNDEKNVSKWTEKQTKYGMRGDVLITVKGSGCGALHFLALPQVAIGRQLMAIRSKESNSLFIFQKLKVKNVYFEKLSLGNMIPGLSRSDILNTKIFFPSLSEQTKIANFLTAIDTRLQQLNQKKILLEKYKKGVMQKIFSQEIRFKDDEGKDFPEWEVKSLRLVAYKVLDKNKDNNISFVLTNSAEKGIVSQKDYFDKDIANQNNLGNYYIVKKDDFVYNPRISSFAPVGPIKRNKLEEGVMSPLYTVFRFKQHNLSFFEYYFESTEWHRYMHSIANYGARHDRMNITTSDFFEMPLPLPVQGEQTQIANFLTAIDDRISLVEQQIQKTEAYKKGLLQQMFV
ncbi:MAG: restriction endonuclease subunit S [Chitinophagales bacterium]|nr:restriction endonuclease subunit S [Chitinophagales bacterium]